MARLLPYKRQITPVIPEGARLFGADAIWQLVTKGCGATGCAFDGAALPPSRLLAGIISSLSAIRKLERSFVNFRVAR